ncbi:hypothetical protein GW17_00041883 [Ensete ventricosum]|nr:hypothetical protein GW17_00041883 [Ensete ventricosum]
MHRVDAVGNSPGVHRELAEGIGSLLGWHKGVRQKKTETRQKIIGGGRKAYREKFAGNTSGDHRKKTKRLGAKMPEAAELMEYVGSSLRVSGVCQDGAREFAKRRPRFVGRLSGVAEKLVGSRDVGSRRKFARRFTEGIGKLIGNVKGDRRSEDWRTYRKIVGGCRSMRDERRLDRPYHRIQATGISFQWVDRLGGG